METYSYHRVIMRKMMWPLYCPVCRISTESMDSLHIVHGLLGHCPWTPWTLSMESVESLDNYILDKVQGANTGWTMDSVDIVTVSLDIVHGLSGKSGHCRWIPGRSSVGLDSGLRFFFSYAKCRIPLIAAQNKP